MVHYGFTLSLFQSTNYRIGNLPDQIDGYSTYDWMYPAEHPCGNMAVVKAGDDPSMTSVYFNDQWNGVLAFLDYTKIPDDSITEYRIDFNIDSITVPSANFPPFDSEFQVTLLLGSLAWDSQGADYLTQKFYVGATKEV